MAVRMTYFHRGEDEPENLMQLIQDMGISMFNFRYLVPVGRASGKKVDVDHYRRLSERIWEVGRELGIKEGYSDPFPELLVNEKRKKEIDGNVDLLEGVTGCSIAFTPQYITPQGTVELYPYFPVYIADTQEEKLEKIWYENELLNRFRYSRSLLEGKCGDCVYKFACGGCRGAASAMGNFWVKIPGAG